MANVELENAIKNYKSSNTTPCEEFKQIVNGFFQSEGTVSACPLSPPLISGEKGGGKKGDKLVVNPVVTFGQNYTPESFYKKLFFIRSAMEREKKNKILC
jgi:hypothetical protein